jgi:hypothetical protein
MSLSELLEPAASVARWNEGVGSDAEKGRDSLLSDLQSAAYVCDSSYGGGGRRAHRRANARPLFNSDRSAIRPGAGSEPARCHEEVGGAAAFISKARTAASGRNGRS